MSSDLVGGEQVSGRWRSAARRNRVISVLLILAAVAGIAWLARTLAHTGEAQSFANRRGRPSTTVGVGIATRADLPIVLDALGTVTPPATVTVTPQVSGILTQILFREGQMVRAGETLAVIDPRPFVMAQTQAEGALLRDRAQLDVARIEAERDRTLLKQDSIAEQDVDTQVALVKQLEGSVKMDVASLDSARLNVEFTRITSPVNGRVGLRVVDLGNYVAAGAGGGIAVVTEISPIDVEFTLPQDVLPELQTRLATGAKLAATALDRTQAFTLGEGTFSALDNQIDINTGTVKAKARFDNEAGKLFPSQFVNVHLVLDTLKDAVVVPASAVRAGARGDFVYVLQPDRTVSVRQVKRGQINGDSVQITTGLQVGEQVITEGGDRLTDGAKVQLAGDIRPSKLGAAGWQGKTAQASGHAQSQPGAPADGSQGQADQGGGQHRHHKRPPATPPATPSGAASQ